jgi:antitoxin ParD1/3/4
MTITLPDEMRERIEVLMKRCGCPSTVDYLTHLIEEAETDAMIDDLRGPPELTPRNREELEKMLEEGINSGPAIRVTPEFWEECRRRVQERLMARRKS